MTRTGRQQGPTGGPFHQIVLLSAVLLLIAVFAVTVTSEYLEPTKNIGLDLIGNKTHYIYFKRSEPRRKREIVSKIKEETEHAIMKMIEEPSCREDCKKLQKQLKTLDSSIDFTMRQLMFIKKEVENVLSGCMNRTSVEEDSNEVELPLSNGNLEDITTGRASDDVIVDHDLAGSGKVETYFRWPAPDEAYAPWSPDQQPMPWYMDQQSQSWTPPQGDHPWPPVEPSYPWPPAEPQFRDGIPPTGPDSSSLGEPTITAPGEDVKTGQQLSVSLPKSLEKVCTTVPGPPGSNGYICSPVHNLLSQNQPPSGNFYLQVVGRSQTHVPTAISTPNPFAFPTLSGSPVIVPDSAADPDQLIPVYNPKNGRITFQNYIQSLPYGHQPQFVAPTHHQSVPHHLPISVPVQQYVVAQLAPPSFSATQPQYSPAMMIQPQYQPPLPVQPQYIMPSYQPQLVYQNQFVPSYQPSTSYQPTTSYQSATSYQPPVFVPQFGSSKSQPGSEPQCSYVIVPNSPMQTYRFPKVSGVLETIQRTGILPKKKGHRTGNSTNLKMNVLGYCPPGSRMCGDQKTCVEEDNWCDSKIDCLDLSDEKSCSCKQRILLEKYCDSYFDCPKGEDELGCSGCQSDMFSCDDASEEDSKLTCLPLEKRCDSVKDCPNGKDEIDCSLISDKHHVLEASVVSYSEGFLFRNWRGVWYPVCSTSTWHKDACKAEFGSLAGTPDVRHETLEGYSGMLANQVGEGADFVHSCANALPGTSLWVKCPDPQCGMKPVHLLKHRRKRDVPPANPPIHYIDRYPHTDEPAFKSTPQAMQFVKEFFNSLSIFDKKKFYKQFWGPLTKSYMGMQSVAEEEEKRKGADLVSPIDPSQLSWQYYIHPHQHVMSPNFAPPGLFPDYGTESQYSQGYNPYDNHQYPQHNFNNYQQPVTYQNFIRQNRDAAGLGEPRVASLLRVVGGSKSQPGAWPWLVIIHRDGIFHCGGTILTPDTILTAAHCVNQFEDHYYEIQAGVLRRSSFSPQEQTRKVDQAITHEGYDSTTMINDVALLKLSTPLKFNRWVLPACLPPTSIPSLPLPGTICTAIGWGALYEHGPDPDHLREVNVPILPICRHRVDQLGQSICAGYIDGGMDTCQGDSGGPLVCRLNGNKWYIAGIVSHGQGCARFAEPGVYTKVSLFKKWIQHNLAWPERTSKASRVKCPGPVCSSGRCLPESSRCNSKVECLNGEDESNCNGMLFDSLFNEKSESKSNINTSFGRDASEGNNSSMNISSDETVETTPSEVTESPGTTEASPEPVLHTQQTRSVDITDLFTCKQLNQRIISSRVCDNLLDCEDGSDENGCSCKDRLKHLSPDLICDGVIDCRDFTDEEDCSEKCSKDEFYCYKSKMCIPNVERCNSEKECHYGEDEENCYALVDHDIPLESLKTPPLRTNGSVIYFSNGNWSRYCNSPNPASSAVKICQHLGFWNAQELQLLNDEKLGSREESCSQLYIRCSSPVDKLWLAPLFISGSPLTLGVLVATDWIIAPLSGLQFPNSKVYLNTWLGKNNLNIKVEGQYDQYIRINGDATPYGEAAAVLLHLEKPADINRNTVPLPFPNWPTPANENEKCEAMTMTDKGEIISVHLSPVICKEGLRCYNVKGSTPLCEFSGVIVCHSDYGPYLASVMSVNVCVSSYFEAKDLTHEKGILNNLINSGSYSTLEEDTCESVRCESGECLSWTKIGDGITDCFDGSDEGSDAWWRKEEYCKSNKIQCNCRAGEIRCKNGKCIAARSFCNGEKDCEDGSDEESCNCAGYLSMTRPASLCDGVQNCNDKSDEALDFCNNRTDCSGPKRFQCHSSGSCIPSSFVCDGDNDCLNAEDEAMCIAVRSPPDKPKEGLVYSRLYGELIPQCLESQDDLAEKICSLRKCDGVKEFHYSKVPYFFVQTDAFSLVRLNEKTSISLRPGRNFASVKQSPNETCSALYVICQ